MPDPRDDDSAEPERTEKKSGPGESAAGDTAAGDTAAGDTAAGDTAAGDTAAGDTAAGDTAASAGSEPREPLIPLIRVTPRGRNRLLLVGLAVVVLWWLLVQSWDAMGPFIAALVLAYLMTPLLELLARFVPRVVAILAIYAAFIGTVWGLGAWFTPVVQGQFQQFSEQAPAYSEQIQRWAADFTSWYNSLPISDEVRQSIGNSLRNAGESIGSSLQQAVMSAFSIVTRAMGFVVGLVIVPFWLFYVLKDKNRGVAAFNNMLPPNWRADVWQVIRIINGVLSAYVRGQFVLAVIVGMATTVGMIIVGAPYALLLGLFSGLTEIVPVLGPIIGAIPGLAVALLSGDWILALKVLAVYLIVQQLENNLLVPKIQGDSVKMHPAIIMVSLVVGSQVAGLFGLIIAVPAAAVLRDVYLYLFRRFGTDVQPEA